MEYTLDNTEKSRKKRENSMAETELRIRRATLADAESILDIYRPYVEETVMLLVVTPESSIFAFSAASFRRCKAIGS